MPYAATHILVAMILVDVLRDHVFKLKRRFLPNKYVLLAGIAGLAPDIDVPISFLTGIELHRTFTHSIWIPLIFFSGFLISYYLKKDRIYKIFLMFTIGVSLHIILDMFLLGTVHIFFPFNNTAYGFYLLQPFENMGWNMFSAIDAVLLLGWLVHEELEHKISDYL